MVNCLCALLYMHTWLRSIIIRLWPKKKTGRLQLNMNSVLYHFAPVSVSCSPFREREEEVPRYFSQYWSFKMCQIPTLIIRLWLLIKTKSCCLARAPNGFMQLHYMAANDNHTALTPMPTEHTQHVLLHILMYLLHSPFSSQSIWL